MNVSNITIVRCGSSVTAEKSQNYVKLSTTKTVHMLKAHGVSQPHISLGHVVLAY